MITRDANDLVGQTACAFAGDILKRLRTVPSCGGLAGMTWASDAANEIEWLRSEVRRLGALKTPQDQYNLGYAKAQEDMRRALGLDE
jgi:hypothetical protein